jgi:tetratricopeptide (TPR) repeat protein
VDSEAPKIGLAVIARNEAATLPGLLASIKGAFDQVVLVDTGSTDGTTDLFQEWAAQQDGLITTCQHFDWVDDFAAARIYADSLFHPTIEWFAWADCDDELHGAQHLRQIAAAAPPDLAAYVARYDYAQDSEGRCVCTLQRERLVRRGAGTWEGRVHEAQSLAGPVQAIDPALVEWRHRKPIEQATTSNDRNLRILRKWVRDEPDNSRVLMYLGTELLTRGDAKAAIRWYRRYLKQEPGWTEERAQVHRKLALAYIATRQPDKAIETALQALRLLPSWPDSALTLAEAHYELREIEKAEHWARHALAQGMPATMLIVNPLDYTVSPLVVLAGCASARGDVDEAIGLAEQVFAAQGAHPALVAAYPRWLTERKRDSTASTVLALADLLIAHDEQLNALTVLEAAPHYVRDHEQVVALRSMLRERLTPLYEPAGYLDRYQTGGSKPEDMTPDAQVIELGDHLPRCAFLLRNLDEMAAAA